MSLSYTERIPYTTNPTAKALFALMDEKQTNLCFSVDVTTKQAMLNLANMMGPEICILKTHIDIVEDFDQDLVIQLQRLSEKHNFLLFEDRKFADIGNTVKRQYQNGIYHIADWAHIINTHTVAGPGSIEGLKEIGLHKGRGLFLLAEMTPKGNLATGEYTDKSVAMAQAHNDFVIGFIATRKLMDDHGMINMTPGVQLADGGDVLGQKYTTPAHVIRENESDVIIVGRGIYGSKHPLEEAKKYRISGWQAYQSRLKP